MSRTFFLKSIVVVIALAFTVLLGVKAALAAGDSIYPKDCLIIEAERPAH